MVSDDDEGGDLRTIAADWTPIVGDSERDDLLGEGEYLTNESLRNGLDIMD